MLRIVGRDSSKTASIPTIQNAIFLTVFQLLCGTMPVLLEVRVCPLILLRLLISVKTFVDVIPILRSLSASARSLKISAEGFHERRAGIHRPNLINWLPFPERVYGFIFRKSVFGVSDGREGFY